MKKSQRKTQARKKAQAVQTAATPPTRRSVLTKFGIGGAAFVGVAGAGFWTVNSFRAHAAEHDLSRIGQGQPAIVQVHDPSCALCTELQRQTRRALRSSYGTEPLYLVANINTEEGQAFQATHAVPHVTLVLLDGDGNVLDVLRGVRQQDELSEIFTQHFGPA